MELSNTPNLNPDVIKAAVKAAEDEVPRYIELCGIENLLMAVYKSGFVRGYIYSESLKQQKE